MATILDISILKGFSIIFVMVLIIVLVYAILQFTKALGDSKGMHILIAFLIGLLSLLVPDVTELVATMVPWFTVFFLFVVFMLLGYKLFGATDSDIAGFMKTDKTIGWGIFVVSIIIMVAATGNVYGQRHLTGSDGEPLPVDDISIDASGSEPDKWSSNIYSTLYHPKILGMLLLFAIGAVTVGVLASSGQ